MGTDTTDIGPSTESEYRGVFVAAPDGILLVDQKGVIRDVNPAAEEMFAYAAEEMIGQAVELLVPEAARSRHARYREDFSQDPHPRPMGIGLELRGTRKDGVTFPVEISLSPLQRDSEVLVIAAVRDLSQHQRLRRFGAGTLRAAEEERQKLARELHDDTAQQLAASLLRIRMAQKTEDPDDRAAILDELRAEILRTAESVRRIARGLRPPALQDVGVIAALQSHVRSLSEASDLEVRLVNNVPSEVFDIHLDDDARLVIYRVIQEALSNAIRHSGAERVQVEVSLEGEKADRRIVVRIIDDGIGFDPNRIESAEGGGLGLIGMQERAMIVGGSLSVESSADEGTRVRMEVPLDPGGHIYGGRGHG